MGYLGNSPYWWAEKGGYTVNIDEAKLFSSDECNQIIRSSKGTHDWKMWDKSIVEKAIYRTIDIQLLKQREL